MKKITYLILSLVAILALTTATVYASNEFTATDNFEFEVNGMTFSASGSIDELTVYDTYFKVDVADGSEFTITSSDGYTYSIPVSNTINLDCPGGESVLSIHGDGEHVYSFTPSTDTCVATGGGGGTTSSPGTPPPSGPSEEPSTDSETTNESTVGEPATVTEDTISHTAGEPAVNAGGKVTLGQMSDDAATVASGDVSEVLAKMGAYRDTGLEQEYNNNLTAKVVATENNVSSTVRNTINNFVTYGTKSTGILGAGERAGVVNSYKEAFGKLPSTAEEWNDVVKIANGRWPNERSEAKENRAKTSFQTIYLRQPNMDDPHDNAAVTVMAYGLRPANRNLDSEKVAIYTFRYVFGYSPETASAWDAVRAIAYSGATR